MNDLFSFYSVAPILAPFFEPFRSQCVLWLWQATPLLGWAEVGIWRLTPKRICVMNVWSSHFRANCWIPTPVMPSTHRRSFWWGRLEGTKDPSPNTKAFAIFPAYMSNMCFVPLLLLVRTLRHPENFTPQTWNLNKAYIIHVWKVWKTYMDWRNW